jgi:hypothetical protein
MRVNGENLGRLVLLGALLVPLAAVAHGGPGPGPGACPGCGKMGGPGAPAFDPKTVTTIQGEITDIQRFAGRHGHEGIHLTVAMGSEKLAMLLGPDFYVDGQALKLAKGDKVEVKGSRTTFKGQPIIIAQEVRRGDQVLALRDASGVPLWRGQRRGRQ